MNGPSPTPSEIFSHSLAAELRPQEVPASVHGQQHRARQARLAQWIAQQGGGVAVLSAGEEIIRNRDNPFPFRSHSDFLYLTGFPEPDAWWLMRVDDKGNTETVLACRPRDAEREIWDGIRVGPQHAAQRFAADRAIELSALDETV
ncbi:MAG: aminopeptidase P N-terminal domain-containing protein, partial [Betaproteobacteria bacterium]